MRGQGSSHSIGVVRECSFVVSLQSVLKPMSARTAALCDSGIASEIRSFLADDREFACALIAEARVALTPSVHAWLAESGSFFLVFQDFWFLEDWDDAHAGDIEEERDRWLQSISYSDFEDCWGNELFWDQVREFPDNFGYSP